MPFPSCTLGLRYDKLLSGLVWSPRQLQTYWQSSAPASDSHELESGNYRACSRLHNRRWNPHRCRWQLLATCVRGMGQSEPSFRRLRTGTRKTLRRTLVARQRFRAYVDVDVDPRCDEVWLQCASRMSRFTVRGLSLLSVSGCRCRRHLQTHIILSFQLFVFKILWCWSSKPTSSRINNHNLNNEYHYHHIHRLILTGICQDCSMQYLKLRRYFANF